MSADELPNSGRLLQPYAGHLLDRYVAPAGLGRRRGWMRLTQTALLQVIASLGGFSPQSDLRVMALLATLLAFLSATQ